MKKRFVSRILVTLVSVGVVVFSAVLAARAQTIHAILVGNTKDPNIGYGDKLDLDLIRGLLQDAARQTGMPLKMKVYDDKIPRTEVMNTVKNLNPGTNDTVVFFYTGHGYRMSSFKEKWPAMALESSYGGSAGLDLKWAYDTLKRQNPRLLIVMADACNSVVPVGSIDTHLSVAFGEDQPAAYKKLFLEHKGGIIASSSIPGQYSYGGSTGSQFTVQFINSIKSEISSGNPTWKGVMTKATRSMMSGKQQPQYAIDSKLGGTDGTPVPPYKDDEIYKDDKVEPGKAQFGTLLVTMESHIPYSAQTKQWINMRPQWIQRVIASEGNAAKMKQEMLLFEKHILWTAQKESWKQQRQVWMNKVNGVSSLGQLADPLVEVEGSMKDGIFITLWAKERPTWLQNVRNIGGGSGGGDSYSGGGDKYAVQGGSFGKLLVELEENVAETAKSQEWAGARDGWKSEALSAGSDIPSLGKLLVDFESHIDYSAQTYDWPSRRSAWLSKAQSASSMAQLKSALIEAEKSLNPGSEKQSWSGRKNGWIGDVNGLH